MIRLNKRLVLMLAGLFFMVPLLGKTAVAKRMGGLRGGIHRPAPVHHPNISIDDDGPCSEMDLP